MVEVIPCSYSSLRILTFPLPQSWPLTSTGQLEGWINSLQLIDVEISGKYISPWRGWHVLHQLGNLPLKSALPSFSPYIGGMLSVFV